MTAASARNLPMYQKPSDVRRKRVKPEGKNSQLMIRLQPPGAEPMAPPEEAVPDTSNCTLPIVPPVPEQPMDTPRIVEAAKGYEHIATRPATPQEMETAVELFNEKPKNGIQYLLENHIVSGDPKSTVNFLLTAKGISRHAIGEYLGGRGEAEKCLDALAMTMDFRGRPFDECIRVFFREFFPPGEAAIIYRMMIRFGARFVECNEGIFKAEDVPCVLAYATLMLNTDLHSKSIKTKMTKDQFIRNLRGADGGHDINRAFLEELYDRVTLKEIEMADDNEYRGGRPAGTRWRPDVIKLLTEGAQFKKHGRRGNPHPRWIWVSADMLHVCYGKSRNSTSHDSIPVRGITEVLKGMQTAVFHRVDVEDRNRIEGRCLSLDATHNTDGDGRTLDLEASSEMERKRWFDALRFLVKGYLTD